MIVIFIISILISLIFAPLGCFVLWKRYVYFSDGLAHASMLAAVISIISGIPILCTAIINSIIFSFITYKFKKRSDNNAAIGFISTIMISFALILSYIFPGNLNVTNLLFGDIIAASYDDIIVLFFVLIGLITFFAINYEKLLLMILSRDVAHSRGIKVDLLDISFLLLLSFSVVVTIKIIGSLLVTSIILIPAMVANLISNSPFRMIILSILIAQIMNLFGIILSYHTDMPLSPITILCGGAIYMILLMLIKLIQKCKRNL